jgi:predicted small metal-binding protein
MDRKELIQRIKEIAISLPELDDDIILLIIKQNHNTTDISDNEILKIINNIKKSGQRARGMSTIDVLGYLDTTNSKFDKSGFTEIKKLGEGAYGSVVKFQTSSNFVAVKTLQKYDDEIKSDFVREIGSLSILSLLGSEHIPTYCGFNDHELCLEFADSDLFEWWKRASKEQLVQHLPKIVDWLLKGLSDQQSVGIVNADIKPMNMLIWYDGNDIKKVAYTDFGLATSFPEKDIEMYTSWYRPPEYFDGDWKKQASFQTDCWALAKSILNLCMTEKELVNMVKAYENPKYIKIYKYITEKEIPNAPDIFKRYLRDDQVAELTRMISVNPKERCIVSVKAFDHQREWKIIKSQNVQKTVFEWMYDVLSDFKERKSLLLSYDLLNRYYLVKPVDTVTLQGYACAAMYIASLWSEFYAPELRDYYYMTDKTYTTSQLREFSFDLLYTLEGLVWLPGLERLEKKFKTKKLESLLESVDYDLSKL